MREILRSFTIVEKGRLGRRLTISESPKPNTCLITLFNSGEDGNDRHAQTIELTRNQWEELTEIGSRYASNFDWAKEPTQSDLPLPIPADL